MTGKYKSQYAWTNCSIVIRTQVNILLDALREVLGESLVGTYLHGSFHVTLNRGICLHGKPIEEVFPLVPLQYYIASIVGDFEDARDGRTTMPVYFILNACRVYAYLLEGSIFSKDEGGAWGIRSLPKEFRAIICFC